MKRLSNTFRTRSLESLEHRLLLTGNDCAPVITQQGSTVIVVGRAGDDVVELQLGQSQHVLNFSGNLYTFDANQVDEIRIGGGFGNNSITITGSDLDDRGSAIGLTGSLTSSAYTALSFSFQETTLVGGSGNDYAEIYGSDEADSLQALPESSTIVTPTVTLTSQDFERIDAYGRGGNDVGQLYGTQGPDQMYALDAYVALFGGGIARVNRGFERMDGFGRGGNDLARFFDSTTNDTFVSRSDIAYLRTPSRVSYAKDFENVEAISVNGGTDRAQLFADATSVETVTVTNDEVTISGAGYARTAQDFAIHSAVSNGTNDEVEILELGRGEGVRTDGNTTEIIGPQNTDRFVGFAEIVAPNEFEQLVESLEPYLPQAMINEVAARLAVQPANVVEGTNSGDVFVGTGLDEEFMGLGGNDEIYSGDGDDRVRGGGGNDRIDTNDGDDVGVGGGGNDELKGGRNDDILLGGLGDDIVDGEEGNDIVMGGAGSDLFRFISLDETVIVTDYTLSQDRIELINIEDDDDDDDDDNDDAVTLGSQYGSMTINHPDGMNIVLLGISPTLTLDDLNVSFVDGDDQTLFDPDA